MAPSSSRRRLGVGSIAGLFALFFFGLVLFQRMWTFHSALSLAQGNAAHLETLYNEAMDEAADWRNKYDADLKKVTEALEERLKQYNDLEAKVKLMQKINQEFEGKVEVCKAELLAEKQKCETTNKQAQGNQSAANKVS